MSLAIRRSTGAARAALIQDLGPGEHELTAAQLVLIDKSVSLLQITMAIESWVRQHGVMKGKGLQPVLSQYISFVNSLRLCLRELGVTRRVEDQLLTPLQIAAEVDDGHRKSG